MTTDTPPVTLRPITPADEPLLLRLYATTRADEMAVVPWADTEKDAFVRMQFRAQHTYYHQHYAGANFDLILLGDEPVGRVYVHRMADEYRLMEITLLPEYRNKGIGSGIIRQVMAKARAEGVAVRLHVENYNPAYRLYLRFGFVPVGENGVYTLMEWQPGASPEKTESDHD